MTEQSDQKKEFVREEIHGKPVNRKRLSMKALSAAVCGVAFAMAASLVFLAAAQISGAWKRQHSKQEIALTETENQTEAVPEETETSQEAVPQETVIVNEVSMTLEDYQSLQNQLYAIGKAANASLVTITSVVSSADWFNNEYDTNGSGTGMIIASTDTEVLILTENSAIVDSSRITVTFHDGTAVNAAVKGQDSATGLVVLSTARSDISADTFGLISVAQLGNSTMASDCELAVAVGRPLSDTGSILTGMVTSQTMEIVRTDNNFGMLTTNMVGDTDSEGFLLNAKGQVIGMMLKNLRSEETGNMICAAGITGLRPLINQLINGDAIGYAGVYVTTITDEIARTYSLPAGVYVREVEVDSPAMTAGLQSGDVITAINGEVFTTVSGWYSQLVKLAPAQTCTLTIQRQGQDGYHEMELDLILGVLQ